MKKAEEYCWTITTTAGRSCCSLSGYSILEFELHLEALVHTCILNSALRKMSISPDLPERNYCEGVYLLTFGLGSDRNQASHRTQTGSPWFCRRTPRHTLQKTTPILVISLPTHNSQSAYHISPRYTNSAVCTVS